MWYIKIAIELENGQIQEHTAKGENYRLLMEAIAEIPYTHTILNVVGFRAREEKVA